MVGSDFPFSIFEASRAVGLFFPLLWWRMFSDLFFLRRPGPVMCGSFFASSEVEAIVL